MNCKKRFSFNHNGVVRFTRIGRGKHVISNKRIAAFNSRGCLRVLMSRHIQTLVRFDIIALPTAVMNTYISV